MRSEVRKALDQLMAKIDSDPALSAAVDKVQEIETMLGPSSLDDVGDARLRLPYASDPPPKSDRWKMPTDA